MCFIFSIHAYINPELTLKTLCKQKKIEQRFILMRVDLRDSPVATQEGP